MLCNCVVSSAYYRELSLCMQCCNTSDTKKLKASLLSTFIQTCVSLLCPLFSPVLGNDYLTTSTMLLFDTCDSRACVKLSVMDDSIAENVKSFIITLEMTHPKIHLESVHGVVTIVDDDGMYILRSFFMSTLSRNFYRNYYAKYFRAHCIELCNVLFLEKLDVMIYRVLLLKALF